MNSTSTNHYMKIIKYAALISFSLFISLNLSAQKKLPGSAPTVQAGDSTKNKMQDKKPEGPKPYDKVITEKAITANGFFKVHKVDENYFFEIPNSLLNRDILVVNRISKAAAGNRVAMMGYGGDMIGKRVIQFEKGPDNKIFLKTISFDEVSSDSSQNGMYRSFMNSNLQPLQASFDIQAFSKNKDGVVIDITKYINGDNDIFFFDNRLKKIFSLTTLLPDRSYIQYLKAFPLNIEIRTFKTYVKSAPAQPGNPMGGVAEPASYELNSSMVLLPVVPMQARYFDPRVGYFTTSTVDFDANPQGVKRISMAVRWRLEPKDEDVEKYKRGELVEPKKPILFYIDPATPAKWVPYLIQGVNDWQKAFEQAGFKNAIIAKEAPLGDTTWSIDDARNSAIVYKPSDIANASGPNVNDPRSGEIMETHINWYHNVMELVRNWYLIQAAPTDPRARRMVFSDSLMGQLIRFVSSHEVGHTLGLRHNYGSSSTIPVEDLRNKAWLKIHGHTPSIMDYARFNYVAQPEDSIGDYGMYPHIGEYDRWAIEWGYKWLPQYKSALAEQSFLNKMVSDSLSNNPRLFFGTESDPNDPRDQNEDLGDNAMKASAYGIKNLKRILPNIMKWTKTPNTGYENADEIYDQLTAQFGRYMGHVRKNIGGIESTPAYNEQEKIIYKFTPRATQKEAVNFLQAQLFTTPEWLIDKKLFAYTGLNNLSTISTLQSATINGVLNTRVINNLLSFEMYDSKNAYTVSALFNDLKSGIFSELTTHKAIDIYRRNLQKMYVDRLVELLQPAPKMMIFSTRGTTVTPMPTLDDNDGFSVIKGHMRQLISSIQTALPRMTDNLSRLHLQDLLDRLKDGLKAKNKE